MPGGSTRSILEREIDEDFDLQEVIDVVRRNYIKKALQKTGSVKEAALLLGYNTDQTLRNHIDKLRITM